METVDKARSDAARKAGSVKSEKKRKQSAANLSIARQRKERIFNLGLEADALIQQLGAEAYSTAVSTGVTMVRASLSHPPTEELPAGR